MADNKNLKMQITDEYLEDVIGGAKNHNACPKNVPLQIQKIF